MLECVVNVSEGCDQEVVDDLVRAAGPELLDLHVDPHHNRSVLTLVGEDAPRRVATAAVARIDLRVHQGVHPRIGAVDVVPFVPLGGRPLADAVAARDRFCRWAADELALPCFAYGPERTLPDVRRGAFTTLSPTTGPDRPHPSAGAVAVGARPVLVAYNVWLDRPDPAAARAIALELRRPGLRALGLDVGGRAQVSMNLVEPDRIGPADAADLVTAAGEALAVGVAGCELVGLLPESVLRSVPEQRWAELDLASDRTIESRLG